MGRGQVVRLFVEVDEIGSNLAQDAAKAWPVEEVITAVEANRLDAQIVGGCSVEGFEREPPPAGFMPRGWGDHHEAIDFRSRRDLVELAPIRGDDQDLRNDQDAQRISL